MLGACLLFANVPRPGDREVFGLPVKLPPVTTSLSYYQSNHSKVEAIPLSALPKDTTSERASNVHTISSMMNVKQGSCES